MMKGAEYKPGREKEIYPSNEYLKASIENGELWVCETAKEATAKVLRLDVLEGNIPAEKLYIKHGFQYIDTVQMFYQDTGWTNFKLFEYIL